MKKYKLIFSDVDGTLLNNMHQISPATLDAIQYILEKNIPFIPVSARPPYALLPYMKVLNNPHPIVCYNGALILNKNLTTLYSITLEDQTLTELEQQLTQTPNISINYYSNLDWFTNDVYNLWAKKESEITKLTPKLKPSKLSEVHKILLMGESNQIQLLETKLKLMFPELSIHRSKNEYLEIANKNASKSKAIQFFERLYNVNKEEIIAFGDNFNDMDMLKYVGLSVAMGNSPDAIKTIAKETTTTNNEDGIAKILNKLFKNNI